LNYYNEIDPGAAAWLRELIKEGLIPDGEVDERSIEDILPAELAGYTQCHFFAGIGGWSYALALAGWPEDRPVWTGSCPCQSFSAAGKGKGFADERHLWPAWFHLICQCRPVAVCGEQVAASIGHGWLDLVQADLEGEDYAFGAVVLPACGVGAPHIRQRLWWMADYQGDRLEGCRGENIGRSAARIRARSDGPGCCGPACLVADAERNQEHEEQQRPQAAEGGRCPDEPCGCGASCRMADGERHGQTWLGDSGSIGGPGSQSCLPTGYGAIVHPNPTNGFWGDADWLFCRDGKWRPAQSSFLGLAPGLPEGMVRGGNPRSAAYPLSEDEPARVMRLKGYGNSIVPQAAAEMIMAYMGGGAW
jgi:DNA (cytosine-5)-methyltransferase 1